MRRDPLPWLVLGLALGAGTGCQTAVGNYFSNRARDLGECWRVEAGVHYGLGASAQVAGLAHVGVGGGMRPEGLGLGWVYGRGHVFQGNENHGVPLGPFETFWPVPFPARTPGLHRDGDRGDIHDCFCLLPALFSYQRSGEDRVWIWAQAGSRKHRVHAFDIQVNVHAVLVGASVGFSPGEFVDFLLGWFGLDIAGDDRPFAPLEPAAGR